MPMSNTTDTESAPAKRRQMSATLSLGAYVAYRMKRLRIKAQALSRKADVDPSVISKVLSGKRRTLEHENVQKLAKALGVQWPAMYRAMRNGKAQRTEAGAVNPPA